MLVASNLNLMQNTIKIKLLPLQTVVDARNMTYADWPATILLSVKMKLAKGKLVFAHKTGHPEIWRPKNEKA